MPADWFRGWNLLLIVLIQAYEGVSAKEYNAADFALWEAETCKDEIREPGVCDRLKALGQCPKPETWRKCGRTCKTCKHGEWTEWGPWGDCTTTCGTGVEVRRRICPIGIPCYPSPSEQLRSCEGRPCRVLGRSMRPIIAGRSLKNLYKYEEEEVVRCGKNEFSCPFLKECLDVTKKCDGEPDCPDSSDEYNCPLGLRWDSVFAWQSAKYQTCAESVVEEDGRSYPKIFRRCPGPYDKEVDKFKWRLQGYNGIKCETTHKCLAVNATFTNITEAPYNLSVILDHCDTYNALQHWTCSSSFQVHLLTPHSLPYGVRDRIYLRLSDEGPGNYFEMTSKTDESTQFYHAGSNKRLTICARPTGGYGGGFTMSWKKWEPCDKTCGGGIKKYVEQCTEAEDKGCKNGWKVLQEEECSTDPCPIVCPPGFLEHPSESDKEDIACFKLFSESVTAEQAQERCAASGWSLAADKDLETHKVLLDMLKDKEPAYIGVYEDLSQKVKHPYTNALRYHLDGLHVGMFQPWNDYGEENNRRGCVIGSGENYFGTITNSISGETCSNWTDTDMTDLLEKPEPENYQPYEKKEEKVEEQSTADNFWTWGWSWNFNPQPTVKVEEEDEETINDTISCRNPDLSMSAPWCYVKDGMGRLQKEFCQIKSCLDLESDATPSGVGKTMPDVDKKDTFLIHSLEVAGEDNMCMMVLSTSKLVMALCDCKDNRQLFYWWRGISLVNFKSGMCVALLSTQPKHGSTVSVQTCSRQLAHTNQAWKADNHELVFDGVPNPYGREPPVFSVEHDVENRRAVITDLKTKLFTAWNEKLGMVQMTMLQKRTPGGTFFLLRGRGCGTCVKATRDSMQLYGKVCSHHDLFQRWIRLTMKTFMNLATGLCLSTYRMRSYAVLSKCDIDDVLLHWNFRHMDDGVGFTLLHSVTRFYLTCGCQGYTSVCLSPIEDANAEWEFLVHGRIAYTVETPSYNEMLGYTFIIHTPSNLTKCARPSADTVEPGVEHAVVMTTCQVEDPGNYWVFTDSASQIRHRSLGLCLEANVPLNPEAEGDGSAEGRTKTADNSDPTLLLRPCSSRSLDMQMWIFEPGPTPRDSDGLPGDYIRLARSTDLYLETVPGKAKEKYDDALEVVRRTKSHKWMAITDNGAMIPLGKIKDCARPWEEMKHYRGGWSWSKHGLECQKWSLQWPHSHPFSHLTQPGAGLDRNFCRKPEGIPSDVLDKTGRDLTWCVTTNPSVPWQECSVSRCPLTNVILDKSTGGWYASDGKQNLSYICQAESECYSGTGQDFNGYYEHTGREHCLNWREYNYGDTSWPDHARCMNPNNDTWKPWCWVDKGVAQYCDILKKCPIRCPDPTRLIRYMTVVRITYASSAKMFAAGSTIEVVCRHGYNHTNMPVQRQQLNCTEEGDWFPDELIACRKIFCDKPADVDNAILITKKQFYTYGSVVAYQCKHGHMIEPGRTLIEIKCRANGTWSNLPYKCLHACKKGWTSYNSSCYKVFHDRKVYHDYHSSLSKCSKDEVGSLAAPLNAVEYSFLRSIAIKALGYSDKYLWLGIRDNAPSSYAGPFVSHDWVGDGATATIPRYDLYLDKLTNQSFMVRNVGAAMDGDDNVSYRDRCMYGDGETKQVKSKQCMDDKGMKWMWGTHQHLYNIDTGLCLTGRPYDTASGGKNSLENSTYLSVCDLRDKNQMFTCGPQSGYVLKMRHHKASFVIVDKQKDGEIRIGTAVTAGGYSMWHSVPGFVYLCHWDLKQPDSVFIVHKGAAPSFLSFPKLDPDPCMYNKTGSKLANKTDILDYMKSSNLDWCGCSFIWDDSKSVKSTALANGQGACDIPDTVKGGAKTGLVDCEDAAFADSLCQRSERDSPTRRTRPEACVAITTKSPTEDWMEIRQCATHLPGYICKEPEQWSCPHPKEPENSIPVFETEDPDNMHFGVGLNLTIHCKEGYWFLSQRSKTVVISCNKHLHWGLEPKAKRRPGDPGEFYDNRKDMEKLAKELECVPTDCGDPPDMTGLEIIASDCSEDGSCPYLSTLMYKCLNGTWFHHGKYFHNLTCMADGTWQPMLETSEGCKTVMCPQPIRVPHANTSYDGQFYNDSLTYTCLDGYWFRRYDYTVTSWCDKDGNWVPDIRTMNLTCVLISCYTPATSMVAKSRATIVKRRAMYGRSSILQLQCMPGYWFDRDAFVMNFTCDAKGRWHPLNPAYVRCNRIHCKQPDNIAGATLYGTDYAFGSHVRYYCAQLNWIRRQFKIHSPHWGLCLHVSKPLGYDESDEEGKMDIALDNNCNKRDTPFHWWVWYWSHHIRNPASDKCLTAVALPSMEEDAVAVRAEVCKKSNVLQWWTCTFSYSNNWFLKLRVVPNGGLLSTSTDEEAFWSGHSPVIPFITGNGSATDVLSYWKIFGNDDTSVNLCLLREGQFYEQSACNRFGEWYPDPGNIECTLVDCGEPPKLSTSTIHMLSDDTEQKPSDEDSSEGLVSGAYPVMTKVRYMCDEGHWVESGQFFVEVTCLDNSMWHPDPYERRCVKAKCPQPQVTAHAKITIKRHTDVEPKDMEEVLERMSEQEEVPLIPSGGEVNYRHGVNETFIPEYMDQARLLCSPGFWVPKIVFKSSHRDPQFSRNRLAGINAVTADCLRNGVWSVPNIHQGIRCEPLHCLAPAAISNAKIVNVQDKEEGPDVLVNRTANATDAGNFSVMSGDAEDLKTYVYNTIIQYQCDLGYWFTVSRTYVEAHCNETGQWGPDPSTLSCVPVSCGDPGGVSNVKKVGESYGIHSEVVYQCAEGFKVANHLKEQVLKCMSDGEWFPPPMSVLCEPVECLTLPNVAHATFVNETQRYLWKYVTGDKVAMLCDEGYQLDGGIREVPFVCGMEGTWIPNEEDESLDAFKCKHAVCAPPTLATNTQIKNLKSEYLLEEIVFISCVRGMRYIGRVEYMHPFTCSLPSSKPGVTLPAATPSAATKARAAAWWPDPERVYCVPVECQHPGTVPKMETVVNEMSFGDSARFMCDIGFKLSHTDKPAILTHCSEGAVWKPDPATFECVPITCPRPPIHESVFPVYSKETEARFYFGQKVVLKCGDNQRLVGFNDRSSPPKAVEISCTKDGTWSAESGHLHCDDAVCPHPGAIEKAKLILEHDDQDVYAIFTEMNITCDRGYVLSLTGQSSSHFVCTEFGLWSPTGLLDNKPVCVPLHCQDPGEFGSTIRSIEGYSYGDKALYRALYKQMDLMCTNEGWTRAGGGHETTRHKRDVARTDNVKYPSIGNLLRFVELRCLSPAIPPNSWLSGFVRQKYTRGYHLRVNCDDGYIMGQNMTHVEIICSDAGEWHPRLKDIRCFRANLTLCPLPTPIGNASIIGDLYSTSGELVVQCYEGYETRKGRSQIKVRCTEEFVWEPDLRNVNCSLLTCPDPPPMVNAEVRPVSALYGAKALYTCHDGYSFDLFGFETFLVVVCGATSTWMPDPKSQWCRPVDCRKPPYLPYARVKYDSVLFNSTATYNCMEGYHLEGNKMIHSVTAKCTSNGGWSFEDMQVGQNLRCEPVDCGNPPTFDEAELVIVESSYYKGKALYRCPVGYEIAHGIHRFYYACSADGNWILESNRTDLPKCKKVTCPLPPESEGMLQKRINRTLHAPVRNTYGDNLNYVCAANYVGLNGEKTYSSECTWYGEWEPDPAGFDCYVLTTQCKMPPIMPHALGRGGLKIGSTWKYTCKDGYEIKHGIIQTSMTCVKNDHGGTEWSPAFASLSKCVEVSCSPPMMLPPFAKAFDSKGLEISTESPDQEKYDLSKNSRISVRCIEGYWEAKSKTSEKQSVCTSSLTWTPPVEDLITCTPVACYRPAQFLMWGGLFTKPIYAYDSFVRITCPEGQHFREIRLHSVESRCGQNGTFAPDPARLVCSNTTCRNHVMPNGFIVAVSTHNWNGLAEYRCHSGYSFSAHTHKMMYICGADGRWVPDINRVKCQRIFCGPLDIEYLVAEEGMQVASGESHNVHCVEGYQLTTLNDTYVKRLTCTDDGTYKPAVSTLQCVPRTCDFPKHSKNSNVYGDYVFGGIVTLQCDWGYWLGGNRTKVEAECQSDGTWSVDLSKDHDCVPVMCPEPVVPVNATLEKNSRGFNAHIIYTCDKGFWMTSLPGGSAYQLTQTCSHDGQWTPVANVTCVRIVCPTPPVIPGANRTVEGMDFGASVLYICHAMKWLAVKDETRWVLTGKKETNVTCLKNAQWSELEGERCLAFNETKSISGRARRLGDTSSLKTLSTKLKKHWLKFNPDEMSISDSIHSAVNVPENLKYNEEVRKNVRFMWDEDPLTLWIGSNITNPVGGRKGYEVDIYLGRPYALFGIMMMCSDDYISLVSDFSIVFSGSGRQLGALGDFKMYGDKGISGKIVPNFPLNYSSIANTFLYEGIREEVEWLHLIFYPLDLRRSPAIREIGLYVSDVEWEAVDSTYPMQSLTAMFLLLTFLLGPLLYFLDSRQRNVIVYAPLGKVEAAAGRFGYRIELIWNRSTPANSETLLQLIGVRESPAVWLPPRIVSQKSSRSAVLLPVSKNRQLGEVKKLRVLIWIRDHRETAVAKFCELTHLKRAKVTELHTGAVLMTRVDKPVGEPTTWSGVTAFKPYPLKLRRMPTDWLSELKQEKWFGLLCCHMLFSVVQPPPSSRLLRLERFFIVIIANLLGCLAASWTQIGIRHYPSSEFSILEPTPADDTTDAALSGLLVYLLSGIVGSLVCLPVPFLFRFLFGCVYREKRDERQADFDDLNKFCVHDVMGGKEPRLPFLSPLQTPMSMFLNIKVREGMKDAATSFSDQLLSSYIVKRRWSDSALVRGDNLRSALYGANKIDRRTKPSSRPGQSAYDPARVKHVTVVTHSPVTQGLKSTFLHTIALAGCLLLVLVLAVTFMYVAYDVSAQDPSGLATACALSILLNVALVFTADAVVAVRWLHENAVFT